MKRSILIAMLGVAALTIGSPFLSFSQTKDKMGEMSGPPSKAAAGSKAEAEVVQVINERRAALLRGDAETIARQYADDFIGIGASGRVFNKEESVASVKSGDAKWLSIDRSDLK